MSRERKAQRWEAENQIHYLWYLSIFRPGVCITKVAVLLDESEAFGFKFHKIVLCWLNIATSSILYVAVVGLVNLMIRLTIHKDYRDCIILSVKRQLDSVVDVTSLMPSRKLCVAQGDKETHAQSYKVDIWAYRLTMKVQRPGHRTALAQTIKRRALIQSIFCFAQRHPEAIFF